MHGGDSAAVIEALKASGLRGMGGAGFPTGVKWELVRQAPGDTKYVICNADESEPGTFKDRVILQTLPDLVLEGMALAAVTVGARKAIIYIRHEYARQRDVLLKTLRQRQAEGIVGPYMMGSSQHVDFEIFESPGGYICGEETALLEALEDRRAEPRHKPPFPGTHGLFGAPTLLNNVETFAMVPGIVLNGGDWWAEHGRNGAKGLKFLAVSGQVKNPGVYEVPLGITVHELIERAGGMRYGRTLKAFAPGGASSGFLPASMADISLDFRTLAEAGSMLGSGAVVVVGDDVCMLELALNVGRFFRNESCGKCVPCRVGSEKIVTLLEGILEGRGSWADLELIEELSATMALTSICGLGQAAPNPILSVIKHFKGDIRRYLKGIASVASMSEATIGNRDEQRAFRLSASPWTANRSTWRPAPPCTRPPDRRASTCRCCATRPSWSRSASAACAWSKWKAAACCRPPACARPRTAWWCTRTATR